MPTAEFQQLQEQLEDTKRHLNKFKALYNNLKARKDSSRSGVRERERAFETPVLIGT